MIAALANCVTKVKADGLNNAGDFSSPSRGGEIRSCAGDKQGATSPHQTGDGRQDRHRLRGQPQRTHRHQQPCDLRLRGDIKRQSHRRGGRRSARRFERCQSNDLALLQAPSTATFKDFVRIRDRSIRSGDSVVAIGFPYHGLLTSDFTVTTGIVESLSGIRNDSRFLQISAPVQPGNSGGPLFDTSGQIVGVVSGKLDALRIRPATGNIPENINFAIKTGALRDFLDNSVVPYQTAESKADLKTTEIAGNARPIRC